MAKTSGKILLSVIIPCYNELSNIKRGVLDEVEKYFSRQSYTWEVIISDDASSDGSFELVEKQIKNKRNFVHLKNPKGGKAFAIKSGVDRARGDYVLFSDMDQSTPIAELDKLLPFIRQGEDVIIGSRGFKRENFPILRRIGSPIFLLFRRSLILPKIRDTQCGFKCFKKDVVEKIFSYLQVFRRQRGIGWRVGAWDVELLFVAEKLGSKINEVTVNWRDEDTSDSKQRQFISESIEMLKEVVRVRTNDLLGKYAR